MPASAQTDKRTPGPLERVLALFSEVRAGEGLAVLLLTANLFLLLGSYYIIKTLRESEILSKGMLGLSGAELKAYATAGQAMLLLAVVPAYGFLASKVNRIKLVNITTLVFMGCLGAFFVLAGPMGMSIGLAYFLWVGIFNVFVVAQFWSYANDIYSKDQGKRLFPIIAVGGSLGAIAGPFITSAARSHPYELMLAAAVILGMCLILYNAVNRMQRAGGQAQGSAREAEAPLSKSGAFRLTMRDGYLRRIALMMLLANFVNTTGGYLFDDKVERHAMAQVPDALPGVAQPGAQPDGVLTDGALADGALAGEALPDDERVQAVKRARGAVVSEIYGTFYGLVNLLSFLIQAFVVSRIFKYLGVRRAMFFLPLIAIGGYAAILLLPTLGVVRVAKLAENSTDYSLQNTVRQALFLPTSREAKYKAKAAIDTFFVRFGDAASAFLIFAGINWLGFATRHYAAVCLISLALLLFVVTGIARQHRALSPDDTASE